MARRSNHGCPTVASWITASSVTSTTTTQTSLVGCLEAPIKGEVMLGPRVLGPWSSWYLVTAGAAGGRTCISICHIFKHGGPVCQRRRVIVLLW